MKSAKFTLEVEFDPEITDEDSVASALDTLMETALSTPDILDDCGNPKVGEFFPESDLLGQLRELLTHPDIDDAHHNLREAHKLLGIPTPGYLD